jgi:hypothetical protein
MNKVRDTDLMGPTQRDWLEEAKRVLAGRPASEPNDEKYLWVVRCIEALSLLQRRDDEIADLPVLCKQLFASYPEAADRLEEQGRHARAIPQAAERAGVKTQNGTSR